MVYQRRDRPCRASLRSWFRYGARKLRLRRSFGSEPKAWFLSRGGNPTATLSLLFRYGENSGDSAHAQPHFRISCHHQIFF